MDVQDLDRKLREIDQDLSRRGFPVVQRALYAFSVLAPDPDKRTQYAEDLFDHIADWYFCKYGNQAIWDQTIGEQPVIIRDAVYVARIPFTDRNRVVGITDQIKDVPAEITRSFTEDEVRYVASTCLEAFSDYSALYNLDTRPSLLRVDQWQLVRRAKFDVKAAALLLKEAEDTQGSITHSHQAAEKFMKSALLGFGVDTKIVRRRFSHNLGKIYNELVARHRKFKHLGNAATALDQLLESMDIRYAEIPRSARDAVAAFGAARHICGFIAQQWQLDAERGTPDHKLQPGRFYQDYSGRTYRCVAIERNRKGELVARMFLLEHNFGGMVLDAEMTCKADVGHLYVELTQTETLQRLETRYRSLRASNSTSLSS